MKLDTFLERFRRATAGERCRGDRDLNPDAGPYGDLRPAAVLVAVVDRPGGLSLVLTRRTDNLPDHPGQISFPGGRIEPEDESPEAAALREAEEEIALAPARVRLVGRLDPYLTRTGFAITPVVGIATPPLDLAPNPDEVAAVFEVPLDFFLDPANHGRGSRPNDPRKRQFYVFRHPEHYIWGATAGMLMNLFERLTPS